MARPSNITSRAHSIKRSDRESRNGHKGAVLWLTGLSGAGKSTLAFAMEERLFALGCQVYTLDGDNLRWGLNQDLGFSHGDRTENIRRAGEVAALLARAGLIAIAAFISPYQTDRQNARRAAGGCFHEIYVRASLDVCESRDPKGLYKMARQGQISDFTGISSPYEPPESPELVVDTANSNVAACIASIEAYASEQLIFPKSG